MPELHAVCGSRSTLVRQLLRRIRARRSPGTRTAAGWLLGLLLLAPGVVWADEPETVPHPWVREVRGGLLAHDVGGLWSGHNREGGFDLNGEVLLDRGVLALRAGLLRPNLGFSLNSRGYTNKLYGGWLWELETDSGGFVNLGLGLALHDGKLETRRRDHKQLGSRVLLRIPFELGFTLRGQHRVSILFDHISNAWLASENEGMDSLGLRYGYRF